MLLLAGPTTLTGWAELDFAIPVERRLLGRTLTVPGHEHVQITLPALGLGDDWPMVFGAPDIPSYQYVYEDDEPPKGWGGYWLDVPMIYAIGLTVYTSADSESVRDEVLGQFDEWIRRFSNWTAIGSRALFLGRGVTDRQRRFQMAEGDGNPWLYEGTVHIEGSLDPRPCHSELSLGTSAALAQLSDAPNEWLLAMNMLRSFRAGDYRAAYSEGSTVLEQLLYQYLVANIRHLPPTAQKFILDSVERATLGRLMLVTRQLFGVLVPALEDDKIATVRNRVIHKSAYTPNRSETDLLLSAVLALCGAVRPLPANIEAAVAEK